MSHCPGGHRQIDSTGDHWTLVEHPRGTYRYRMEPCRCVRPRADVLMGWLVALVVSVLLWWALFSFGSWAWERPAEATLKVSGAVLALYGFHVVLRAFVGADLDDLRRRRRSRARREA